VVGNPIATNQIGGKGMKRIKKFWKDESGTAEATSSVILIAAVGILLGAALVTYYGGVEGFFTSASNAYTSYGGNMGPKF
jgi:Flp pilus assembly pilin Flp